ncbi:uncharacterized protein LOC142162798 [Nicotiana tabacum]|uniref:Uncharacterized protein LOC142162798 n=1 Tax=Nicotiana tabacum TaxID=4097 RepID=A0AC58RSJ8_TOBAC
MEAEIRDFNDFLDDTGMTELRYVGREFTWTNSHVHSKIDRALVNDGWIMSMRNNKIIQSLSKIFNNLAEHKEFEGIVKTTWEMNMQGSTIKRVWLKLKRLKNGLKQLHKEEYITIHEKITLIKGELQRIQYTETEVQDPMAEARGSNSTFFHASIKNGNSQKKITKLVTQAGLHTQNQEEVQQEIIQFYQKLLGTTTEEIPAIEPDVMKKGSILTSAQQAKLIKPVTREQIVQALQSIDDSKAPGCDGYNSLFFKKTRAIIGNEIVEAV